MLFIKRLQLIIGYTEDPDKLHTGNKTEERLTMCCWFSRKVVTNVKGELKESEETKERDENILIGKW